MKPIYSDSLHYAGYFYIYIVQIFYEFWSLKLLSADVKMTVILQKDFVTLQA